MKCQNLFSEKNMKNIINLSAAELAQRVVKVKEQANIASPKSCLIKAFTHRSR